MLEEASPPQSSKIRAVASSNPCSAEQKSTPRSKRDLASESMFNKRLVLAMFMGSKLADSRKTSVVSSVQPENSPPIMPPKA